ncbi:hypothetical protein HRG_013772 [Hirsutella rhossiliensis]
MDHDEGEKLNGLLETRVLKERVHLTDYTWSKILLNVITEIEQLDSGKAKDVTDHLTLFWKSQWALDIALPLDECAWLRELEKNIAAHVAFVNDLYSLDKELLTSRYHRNKIGGNIVNAVTIIMQEQNVDLGTARAQVTNLIHEVEESMSPQGLRYIDFLEDMAAGNEISAFEGRMWKDGKLIVLRDKASTFQDCKQWRHRNIRISTSDCGSASLHPPPEPTHCHPFLNGISEASQELTDTFDTVIDTARKFAKFRTGRGC